MNAEYEDIRSRITEPPLWFDERAVPRYGKFHPRHLANIYASEGVLMDIACQGCGQRFHVALSFLNLSHDMTEWAYDEHNNRIETLAGLIQARKIHYGDPPNVRCCEAGPVMNSIPKRVIEYWRREMGRRDWERDPSLEIDLKDGWAANEKSDL